MSLVDKVAGLVDRIVSLVATIATFVTRVAILVAEVAVLASMVLISVAEIAILLTKVARLGTKVLNQVVRIAMFVRSVGARLAHAPVGNTSWRVWIEPAKRGDGIEPGVERSGAPGTAVENNQARGAGARWSLRLTLIANRFRPLRGLGC